MKLTECTIYNIEQKLKEDERNGIVLIDMSSVCSVDFHYLDSDIVKMIKFIQKEYSEKCFFINTSYAVRNCMNNIL